MADVVVDTDVASVLQKGRAPDWVNRHVVGARMWLTFVTVAELWKWAKVRSWREPNHARLDAWVSPRPVIPYDVGVARWWGRLAAPSRPASFALARLSSSRARAQTAGRVPSSS